MTLGKVADSQSCFSNGLETGLLAVKGSTLGSDTIDKKHKSIFSAFLSKFQGGTVGQATLALIAATMGTGALMVSNSLAPSGIIWGTIQMIFCAWLCYYSLVTIVECGSDLKAGSYQEVSVGAFGNWFRHVFNLCCFFTCWGSTIIFLQISCQLFAVICATFGGSVLPAWLTDPESKILILLQATLFVLPLSVPKELKALRYFCFINLCLIILFCIAIYCEGFEYQPISTSFKTVKMFSLSGFSTTFSSAIYLLTPHTNVLTIFSELKRPTVNNMRVVIIWTMLFALTAFVTVGILGYAPFSSNIDILTSQEYANGDILVAYGYTLDGLQQAYPVLIMISMITICASVILSQPFNVRPAKDSFRSSFRTLLKKCNIIKSDADTDPEPFLERFIYIVVTLYSAVLVVLYSDSAQTVMSILGSSFVAFICFVFPSMYYLKLRHGRVTIGEKIIHWCMIIGTGAFSIWATAENIIQAV